MLYGNEFLYNDVNLNSSYAVSDLSQRKKNENYCTAAARVIIAESKVAIEQMRHVLLEEEKSLCSRICLQDISFTFLLSKNCSYRSYD